MARAALVALSYCADPGGHVPALVGAQLPTDQHALDVLRRASWRCPEMHGQVVTFRALDESIVVALHFSGDDQIDRVSVEACAQPIGSSTATWPVDDDTSQATLVESRVDGGDLAQ